MRSLRLVIAHSLLSSDSFHPIQIMLFHQQHRVRTVPPDVATHCQLGLRSMPLLRSSSISTTPAMACCGTTRSTSRNTTIRTRLHLLSWDSTETVIQQQGSNRRRSSARAQSTLTALRYTSMDMAEATNRIHHGHRVGRILSLTISGLSRT